MVLNFSLLIRQLLGLMESILYLEESLMDLTFAEKQKQSRPVPKISHSFLSRLLNVES